MKVKVRFLRNINPRRDDFFAYINRPSLDKAQKGFVCLGVRLILKIYGQNFQGLDWIGLDWIGYILIGLDWIRVKICSQNLHLLCSGAGDHQ